MKDYQKRILIDFDNTIANHESGDDDNVTNQEPIRGAIESIQALITAGYEVIVFTSLSERGEARNIEIQDWLRKYGLHVQVSNTKYPCRAIIDDRGIRFTNWKDIRRYFL